MMAPMRRTLDLALAVLTSLVVAPAFADDADVHYRQGLAYKKDGKTDLAIG